MENYIHVTAGDYSGRSLKRSFELRNIPVPEVVSLEDDLRVGPLQGINTEAGYVERSAWWQSVTEMGTDKAHIDSFNGDLAKMRRIKNVLEQNGNICIWHGVALFDQLMVSRLIQFIHPSSKGIFVVPVSVHVQKNIRGEEFMPEILGVITPEHIVELYPYVRPITMLEIDRAVALWKHVESRNASMRVLNGTSVEMQGINYFDSTLLANCTNEFQNPARVIGKTLVDTRFFVSDIVLNWRLKELVRQNRLEAKGTLRNIRDYEVRIPHT